MILTQKPSEDAKKKLLDFKEKYIRAYLATKDAYCNVHDVHFASSDKLCPQCISERIELKDAIILDKAYFNELKAKGSDFEGGEANLYFNNEGTIDKIFNDEVNLSFKSKVLGKALQKEKLTKKQYIAIAVVILGILMLSVIDALPN